MSTYGDHPKTCEVWAGGGCTCPTPPPTKTTPAPSSASGRKLRARSLADIKIMPSRYLWTDYLPVAELAMLVGKPGVGKSTMAADAAAKLTTGHLAGHYLGRPQTVLYSLTEDSEGVFKARFLAAGGDVARLHVIDVVHGESDGSPLLVDADLDELRQAIAQLRPALVVLDALNSSLDGQQNDNSNIRPQLEKLKALAHQTETAILGIGHFRKSTNGSEPLDSIGGAGAYGQVIRQALGCARDEDEGTCTLSVIKSNGQGLDVASLSYRIEEALVASDDGGTASVGRVEWLGESDTTVRDLLQRTPSGDDDRNERDEAVEWLLNYLGQHGDSPSKAIFQAARGEGISERTLKRARPRAGVDYERIGFPSVTYWRVSQSGHTEPDTEKVAQLADSGPTGADLHKHTDQSGQVHSWATTQVCGPTGPTVARLQIQDARPAVAEAQQLTVEADELAPCGHPIKVINTSNGKCGRCIAERCRADAEDRGRALRQAVLGQSA